MFLTWLIENVFFLEFRHQDNFERKGFYISKRISNFENYFHRKKSSQFFLFSRVEKFLLFTFQPNRKMKMRDFLTKRVFLGNFLEAKKKFFFFIILLCLFLVTENQNLFAKQVSGHRVVSSLLPSFSSFSRNFN